MIRKDARRNVIDLCLIHVSQTSVRNWNVETHVIGKFDFPRPDIYNCPHLITPRLVRSKYFQKGTKLLTVTKSCNLYLVLGLDLVLWLAGWRAGWLPACLAGWLGYI